MPCNDQSAMHTEYTRACLGARPQVKLDFIANLSNSGPGRLKFAPSWPDPHQMLPRFGRVWTPTHENCSKIASKFSQFRRWRGAGHLRVAHRRWATRKSLRRASSGTVPPAITALSGTQCNISPISAQITVPVECATPQKQLMYRCPRAPSHLSIHVLHICVHECNHKCLHHRCLHVAVMQICRYLWTCVYKCIRMHMCVYVFVFDVYMYQYVARNRGTVLVFAPRRRGTPIVLLVC